MKRVLNSGSIKLTNIIGSEQDILKHFESYKLEDKFELICNKSEMLKNILFVFEIKAPILLLLQVFQPSNLGTVETFITSDTDEAYVPPFFYKYDPTGFNQMDGKECNDLHTKYSNFYRSVVNFYYKLRERGVCPQEAQLILPQGLFTTFHLSIDAKELMAFIEKNKNVSPESYGYCETFVLYLEENLPLITKWLKDNGKLV